MDHELDYGCIEYKRTINNISYEKQISYASQMKFRLKEGNHICYYYIGVNDDGSIYGIETDITELLNNFEVIVKSANAKIEDYSIIEYNNKKVIKFTISDDNCIPEFRILLIGASNTGKSTFISNCLYNLTLNIKSKSTISLISNDINANKTISYYPIGYNNKKQMINNYINCEDINQIKSESTDLLYLIDSKSISPNNFINQLYKYNTNNIFAKCILIFVTTIQEIYKYEYLNNKNILFMLRNDRINDITFYSNTRIYNDFYSNICFYNNFIKYDKLHTILKNIITNYNEKLYNILSNTFNDNLFIVDILYNFSQKKYLLLVVSNINNKSNNYDKVIIGSSNESIKGIIESIYLTDIKYDYINKHDNTYTIIVNFEKNINKLKFKTLLLL